MQTAAARAAAAKLRAAQARRETRRRVGARLGKYWSASVAIPRLVILIVSLAGAGLFAAGYGVGIVLAGSRATTAQTRRIEMDRGSRNMVAGPTVKDPGGIEPDPTIVPAGQSREVAGGQGTPGQGSVEPPAKKNPPLPVWWTCIVQRANTPASRAAFHALVAHLEAHGVHAKWFASNQSRTMLGVYVGIPNKDESRQFFERLFALPAPPKSAVTFDFASLRNENLQIYHYDPNDEKR